MEFWRVVTPLYEIVRDCNQLYCEGLSVSEPFANAGAGPAGTRDPVLIPRFQAAIENKSATGGLA
jgi:hypothetical protein